ncbi:p24 complex component [Apophysomyces sp. BC1034]|nr:p24 complex component [Apophysomyces sp. BC1015]KAG0176203.1 p24 complex component [Apophysomyces sp. BC1021]KAG0186451.1 p24 complex component [Apophysomyces sp. BC1034]
MSSVQRLLGILLAIVCISLYTTNALSIDIPAHLSECFFEELTEGDKMTVSFQVGENGHPGIDFTINDPNGQMIKSEARQTSGVHIIRATRTGKYIYCFNNILSSIPARSVNFNVHDMQKFEDTAKEQIDPIEREIRELADSIFAIKAEQEYIVARERQHRNTAESTNSRVKWWSLGQVALLIAVCFWQVIYLKRFFEVKRVV